MRLAKQRRSKQPTIQLEKACIKLLRHYSFVLQRFALGFLALLSIACSSQPERSSDTQQREQLLTQANSLYQSKQYSAAKTLYLQSVGEQQFLPETLYRLGNIFYFEGNFIKAQEYYLASLKQKHQSTKAHYNIANTYLRLAEFHLLFFKDNTSSKDLSKNTQLLLDSIEDFTQYKSKNN